MSTTNESRLTALPAVLTASVIAIGLVTGGLGPLPPAAAVTAGTTSMSTTSLSVSRSLHFVAIDHRLYHPPISVAKPGTSLQVSQSNNWSGYNQGFLEKNTTFSSVSGEWTVPKATQHAAGQDEYSATWVGIGGGCLDTSCTATDSTLIQAGTEQDVAADGTASYSAWWEIIPAPSVVAAIDVHPGDLVDCQITQTLPGVWSIVLKDLTDGQSFSESLPYPSTKLTAEWVEEAPVVVGTSGSGIASLPDLGTAHFTDASANGTNPALVRNEAIQLVDFNGNPIATPSSPSTAGNAFNDCTYASSCRAPRSGSASGGKHHARRLRYSPDGAAK